MLIFYVILLLIFILPLMECLSPSSIVLVLLAEVYIHVTVHHNTFLFK